MLGRKLAKPAQTVYGVASGTVFTADPTVIPDIVQQIEEISIANFARIGFVAFRNAGHLNVGAVGSVPPQLGGDVAFHNLHVVTIHLHLEIGGVHLLQNFVGLLLRVQVEAGHIARINGFDHERDAVPRVFGGGVLVIGDI